MLARGQRKAGDDCDQASEAVPHWFTRFDLRSRRWSLPMDAGFVTGFLADARSRHYRASGTGPGRAVLAGAVVGCAADAAAGFAAGTLLWAGFGFAVRRRFTVALAGLWTS